MEAVRAIGVLLFLQSVTRNNIKYYNRNMIISRLNCSLRDNVIKPQQQGLLFDFSRPIPHKDLPSQTSNQEQHLQSSSSLWSLIPPTATEPNAAGTHI